MADNINISFYGVTLLRDKARVTTIVSVRMIKYCFAILALLVSTQVLAYEKTVPRYALVIGNSNYGFSALPNTINDATDIAAALEDLDYRVTLAFDLKPEEMARVVRDFYQQISSDEAIAIFYYAGHAIQSDSTNYLIPVGADISDLDSLELNAFSMDQLLYSIKISRAEQNIIILDACRDNPFHPPETGNKNNAGIVQLSDGLAPLEAPSNTLVVHATEPGNVASDGKGRNGTYTKALLKYISKSIPAAELFRKVRNDVIKVTNKNQIPWEHSSLTQEFYFGPPINQAISDIVSF
jgi:uncharacterized caspase-like protein